MFGHKYKAYPFRVFIFIPIARPQMIISRIGKSLKRNGSRGNGKQGRVFIYCMKKHLGLRVIKAFNSESRFIKPFPLNSTDRFFPLFQKYIEQKQNLASPTGEFLGNTR